MEGVLVSAKKQGSTITVTVSRGNLIEVPDVTNGTLEAARAVLNNRGFDNIVVVQSNEAGEPGTVVQQTPKGGDKKSKNTKITLTVIADEEPDPSDSPSPDPTDGGDGGGEEDGTGIGGLFNG